MKTLFDLNGDGIVDSGEKTFDFLMMEEITQEEEEAEDYFWEDR